MTLIELDHVTDGQNDGTVISCFNKTTRESYLRVRIDAGPLKGQWAPCWRFQPLIDWSIEGPRAECVVCQRPFRRPLPPPEDGKQLFCRTCERVQRRHEIEQSQDREPSHFGVARAKWQRSRGPR